MHGDLAVYRCDAKLRRGVYFDVKASRLPKVTRSPVEIRRGATTRIHAVFQSLSA
jgi:hypothetical protein